MHKAVRNAIRLFERIQDYEKRVIQRRGPLDRADYEALFGALDLLGQVLAPFVPHLAEEMLLALGRQDGSDLAGPWPQEAVAKAETAR